MEWRQGGGLGLLNTQPWRSAVGARTYITWSSGDQWGWKAKTGRILGQTEIPAVVENRDSHPAALGEKKGRQYERLPNSERATK